MRFFTCLIDEAGDGVPDVTREAFEAFPRARAVPFHWNVIGRVSVLICGDAHPEPLLAMEGEHVGVGVVRLDNRQEVERWTKSTGSKISDLQLVLRTIACTGTRYIPQLLGDFSIVIWDNVNRAGLAVCDAFAVKRLYYVKRDGLWVWSSRAEALALEDRYEAQYLAEFVTNCIPTAGLTVYSGVHAIAGGTLVLLEHGTLVTRRYWSATDYVPETVPRFNASELAATCQELLVDALRPRITPNGGTWAQLSGGLDSSSLVSMAQWMAEAGLSPNGLAGTVTYVDREGTGSDEREYANAVVNRWGIRNEVIIDPSMWYDSRYALPRTDQPLSSLLFYPRERQLSAIVRAAGGSVLLTGVGGDELLTGTMFFFADWLARGRVLAALREMVRWAAIGRVSFWELAYRNALLPLLPSRVQQVCLRSEGEVPAWILPAAARRYNLHNKTFAVAAYSGRNGHKYHHTIVAHLTALGSNLEYGVIEETLDVRHPFLYRPFVEFALQLPIEACAQPYARKWILRHAMHSIVPESVRTRVGKGTPASLYASTLTTHRKLLEPLACESVLADLGVVDPAKLRSAFDDMPCQPHRRDEQHGILQATLMAEAWLQIRSGRWPREAHPDVLEVPKHAHP